MSLHISYEIGLDFEKRKKKNEEAIRAKVKNPLCSCQGADR